MTRAVDDLEREIRMLSDEDKIELFKVLLAELDAPGEPEMERVWLETAQRRHRELVEGSRESVPGPQVIERLRTRPGE